MIDVLFIFNLCFKSYSCHNFKVQTQEKARQTETQAKVEAVFTTASQSGFETEAPLTKEEISLETYLEPNRQLLVEDYITGFHALHSSFVA